MQLELVSQSKLIKLYKMERRVLSYKIINLQWNVYDDCVKLDAIVTSQRILKFGLFTNRFLEHNRPCVVFTPVTHTIAFRSTYKHCLLFAIDKDVFVLNILCCTNPFVYRFFSVLIKKQKYKNFLLVSPVEKYFVSVWV